MDLLELELCIKCNKGGSVLTCGGCPLTIHEDCMSCEARFDGDGKFYCPHCLYKQAIADLEQARKNVELKRKALSLFTDEQHIGKLKKADTRSLGQSGNGTANAIDLPGHGDEISKKNDAVVPKPIKLVEKGKIQNVEDKTQEEEHRTSSPSRDQEPQRNFNNPDEEPTGKENRETFAASTDQDNSVKMHKESNAEEERMEEEDIETSSASNGEVPRPNVHARAKKSRSHSADKDPKAVSVKNKTVKQGGNFEQKSPSVNRPKRSSSAVGTNEVLDGKAKASSRLKQPKKPLVRGTSDVLGNGRRETKAWSEKEVEMIKEGIEKVSATHNNIPWKKILAMGRDVFDETRTPSDLRDKWKRSLREK